MVKRWHIGSYVITFSRGIAGTGFLKMVTSISVKSPEHLLFYMVLHIAEV